MSDALSDFFAAWGEPDRAAQSDAIAGALALQVRYVDPRTPEPLIGPEAIAAYVAQFTEMAPGAIAEIVDATERDGVTRATICFRMADGMEQIGQYFSEANTSGRLTRLVGFVGTGLS